MLPMNSAVSLEAAESNQVADAECEVDSHGCKLDDSLLGGESWRRLWDVDMNLKCGEQENIQDEEFSSNLRNSETHTVKKGPGDSYTLETPTNSKVMYIICSATEQRPYGEEKGGDRPLIVVKTSDSASKRSSQYRGVTRHRYTGRYEAHLWDNSKVKTGAYQNEEQAARAHDSAALKYWGPGAFINFPIDEYKDQLIAMENFTKEEYILLIRRRSPGFARGRSKYRGVTRHHQDGRWEARIGREPGAKYHYLGIFGASFYPDL
ncbi:unnamed protein product [Sphagnum jensenii]|uniref:AP2/ERF domain-containing protein n=1 Tax=Sphagnum jensenii TaxID=128206 RepID=A0ABP0WUI2_9BRYO